MPYSPNSSNSPENKTVVLINLIDEMTAAAVDKSAQSHIQFLYLRTELISTLHDYAEIDRNRIRVVKSVMKQLGCALPGIFTKDEDVDV